MQESILAILLDMDGILYRGDKVIPEALTFMSAIEHLPHIFLTNNPILPPIRVADRLQKMGFKRPDSQQIVTSAEATAQWLTSQKNNYRYFAVGGEGLHIALQQCGTEDEISADFVVIGEGEGIDFEKITIGINLITRNGARLICTNPDHNVDTYINGEYCILPGGGALVSPFAVATETTPVFIGKPNPLLYQMAMQRLGVKAENCLMVGDRPDTDIAGAASLGMKTALIRTGRFLPGSIYPSDLPNPDWDFDSLEPLMDLLNC